MSAGSSRPLPVFSGFELVFDDFLNVFGLV